jgi:hypothetical protein
MDLSGKIRTWVMRISGGKSALGGSGSESYRIGTAFAGGQSPVFAGSKTAPGGEEATRRINEWRLGVYSTGVGVQNRLITRT